MGRTERDDARDPAALILDVLSTAFRKVLRRTAKLADDDPWRNVERSRQWVATLHEEFEALYRNDEADIRVFSRSVDRHRQVFQRNELLYDVSVCEVAPIEDWTHPIRLEYIKRSLWHVESEFDTKPRPVLVDFNKLVMGKAEKNLFVGSVVTDVDQRLRMLEHPARACSGRVYLALIDNPRHWSSGAGTDVEPKQILLWEYANDGWQDVRT